MPTQMDVKAFANAVEVDLPRGAVMKLPPGDNKMLNCIFTVNSRYENCQISNLPNFMEN